MQNVLKVLRYLVFGLFIVCNAIIASVAVWNLSLSRALQNELQVDTYLTFVGAFGLVYIFAIIFLELAQKNAITGRVWFECTWVGIYWLLELAGASALSAIGPPVMCDSSHAAQVLIKDGCASTQVLLAFTWLCTIILLGYLFIMVVSSLIIFQHDPSIWQCQVQDFPWSAHCTLPSAPPSPAAAQFSNPVPRSTIAAPKPRRPAPAAIYNAGLSDYAIEHYRPPSNFAQPAPPPPAPVAYSTRRQQISPLSTSPINLYPQYVQSSFLHASSLSAPSNSEPTLQRELPPSPPPLGNWPRADIISQPTTSRSRARVSSSARTVQGTIAGTTVPSDASISRSFRPTGPRTSSRLGGDHRPPMLDLSNISAYNAVPPQ
ncbi:hypothetical protein AX16_003720 [Volvariella volvacea WC 439]|nr:hypothetical protein AX16_003720 [Volvariella volvacea WC 439]